MAVSEQVLLDVMASTDNAVANIGKLEQANSELKAQIKELQKQEKDGLLSVEESAKARAALTAQIKENNAGIRENAKEVKVFSAEVASADGSINSMRARVSDLNRAWGSLSKDARESDVGRAIAEEMKSLNESINEANLSVGNFKDNIGNYPQVIQSIGIENTKAGKTLSNLGITANTTAQAFAKNMVQGLQAAGKQMLALMANPLVAALAAIAAVVMVVVAAFKRSDDAMTALGVAMAPIKELIDNILEGIGALAVGIAKAFEWIATLGGAIETQGQKAVKLLDKIEDMRRANVIQEAKDEQALALAKEKATDKDSYSAEQRRKALLDAQKIEDLRAKRKEGIAKAELEQWKLENAHNNKTDEYKDREAELTAAILKSETERAQTNRFILKQLNGINKEQREQEASAKKAAEDAYKEYQKRLAEQRKLQAEALRAVEDLRIELMADGQQKDEARERLATERTITALRERLRTEKNLTSESRRLINEQIILQRQLLGEKLADIDERYRQQDAEASAKAEKEKSDEAERIRKERDDAEMAAEANRLQAKADNLSNELALLDEHATRAIEIKGQQLDAEMAAEIAAAEKIGADTSLIEKKYAKAKKAIVDEERNYQLSQAKVITDGIASLFGQATIAGKIAATASVAIDTFQSAFKTGAKAAEYFAAQQYPQGIMAAAQTAVIVASGAKATADIWAVSEKTATTSTGSAGSGAQSAMANASGGSVYTNLPDLTGAYGGQSQLEAMQVIMASAPTPVVSVTEITDMQNSVKVKENSKI